MTPARIHEIGLGLLLSTPALGCYTGVSSTGGDAADDGTGSGGTSAGTAGTGADTDGAGEASVAPSGLGRLTRVEYERSVTAIFGEALVAGVTFDNLPADGKIGRFETNADLNVNIDIVDAYRLVAEDIGAAAGAQAAALLGCDESPECVRAFLVEYGRLVYRRPLTDAELEVFVGFWDASREGGTVQDAMRLVVTAFLQTPDFLYRLERGADGDDGPVRRLTGYEVASRLSFFLWKSGPDAELLDAAEAGLLDDADGVRAQAERLLADPRAEFTILRFHRSWLGIDALDTQLVDATEFPEFEALRDDMAEETERFILHFFREDDAQVGTLFTADYSFASPELAAYYGDGVVDAGPDGSITLDPAQRRGILTHGSYLTAHARTPQRAPIYRGKSLLADVLCMQLVPPPNVNTTIDFDSTASARDQIESATSMGACAGCHQLINPLGFLFENYDGAGHWRTMDGEFPVEAAADVLGTDIDGHYADAPALMSKLAESQQVADCVARQWLRFALSRPEADLDEPSIAAAAGQAGGDMRELVPAITQTDAFRHRRLPEE